MGDKPAEWIHKYHCGDSNWLVAECRSKTAATTALYLQTSSEDMPIPMNLRGRLVPGRHFACVIPTQLVLVTLLAVPMLASDLALRMKTATPVMRRRRCHGYRYDFGPVAGCELFNRRQRNRPVASA